MLFDLHIHTTLSPCSKLDIREILAWSRSFGLDGVCITDHDTMAVRHGVREGLQPDGLCVLFGMEYTTPSGDFLLFGPFEDLAPGRSAEAVLRIAEKRGGVAVAAHPFRRGRSVAERVFREGRCYLAETINGRNADLDNLRAETLRRRYAIGETGGSDAHSLPELGRAATRFPRPVQSRADLIAALRRHQCEPVRNPHRQSAARTGTAG